MNLEAHTLMYMHKVEKALSMPHRYPVFAQDAIKELVKALENPEVSQNIVEQIYITLAKYNQSLDLSYPENQSMVNWLQLVFLEKNSVSDGAKKTVNNNYMVSNEQNYLALHNIALNRHSTRNFLPNPIPGNLIEQAVEIANSLPSACNRQPCSLLLVNTLEIKDQLLGLHCGSTGFRAPLLGVILADSSAFTQDYEDHSIYYHGGLFSAGLVLGLEALQLGSVLLNWHVSPETNLAAKNLLGLTTKEITALIFIGYPNPDKREAYSYKKKASSIIDTI